MVETSTRCGWSRRVREHEQRGRSFPVEREGSGRRRRGRRRASGADGVVESLHKAVGKKYQQVRQIKVKEGRPERGRGSPDLCQIRRITAAGPTDSGDEL
jgi:hypothetical protein